MAASSSNSRWAVVWIAFHVSSAAWTVVRTSTSDTSIPVVWSFGFIATNALRSAYALESKRARYPRILVKPGVLAYLDYLDSNSSCTPTALIVKGVAALARAHIVSDPDDGLCVLDFANTDLVGLLGVQLAADREWVSTEEGRFRAEETGS